MFPNTTMMNAQTWRDILAAMVAVATHTGGRNDEVANDECLRKHE